MIPGLQHAVYDHATPIAEMRAFGRELNEEPEMVATRLRAPTPTGEGGAGEGGS